MTRYLTVHSILGPSGALRGALPGYEHRPEQLRMALAIERALKERHYLFAEAGTGTGKTLAYLVPALLSGRRVMVSTATKTLQEQILSKDLPLLSSKVGLACEAACLKGRQNYLCLYRFEQFDACPELASAEEAKSWPYIRDWALSTKTGDKAELDLPEQFRLWAQLSSTSESCLGPKCPVYESCHLTLARRQAEEARLLIVNHHLFFADLALRGEASGAEGVLPSYDALIFDEAHALEDVAVQHFGKGVSSGRLSDLANDALRWGASSETGGEISSLALKLRGDASHLFGALGASLRWEGQGACGLDETSWEPVQRHVREVLEGLAALSSLTSETQDPGLSSLWRRSTEVSADLQFLSRPERTGYVFWAEQRAQGLQLRASPVDIAQELERRLYPHVDTVIFTSATLTASDDFAFFSHRVGLQGARDRNVERLVVPSPFDFPSQAALYLPPGISEPKDPEFPSQVAEQVLALCELTGGRAFALFTSLRNMQAVYKLCRHRLDVPVLLQGEAPKGVLLERFRAAPSILFASHTFWEGVDVAGRALSLVIIDKLPFSSPADPLVAARIEQQRQKGHDPFTGYQLPRAAVSLRQGFGRLIRTRSDRGIVAILDPRLTQRAYGRVLLAGLPPARRFTDLAGLRRWFGQDEGRSQAVL